MGHNIQVKQQVRWNCKVDLIYGFLKSTITLQQSHWNTRIKWVCLQGERKKRTENDTSCHWHNWLTECEQCSPQLCYIVLHLWLVTVAIVNVFIVVARSVDADDVAVIAEKMKLKMFHWLTIRKRKIQKSPLNANLNRLNALFRLMDGWNLFIYMWALFCTLFLHVLSVISIFAMYFLCFT